MCVRKQLVRRPSRQELGRLRDDLLMIGGQKHPNMDAVPHNLGATARAGSGERFAGARRWICAKLLAWKMTPCLFRKWGSAYFLVSHAADAGKFVDVEKNAIRIAVGDRWTFASLISPTRASRRTGPPVPIPMPLWFCRQTE